MSSELPASQCGAVEPPVLAPAEAAAGLGAGAGVVAVGSSRGVHHAAPVDR
jgi:hypothetical protein